MYLRLNIQKELLFLFLYTIICNLALMNAGATLGYSSVVLPVLTSNRSSITLNAMEIPFFASTVSISQIIGCFLCLIIMNYGRRCTMIVCGVNFSLGWILIASSYNVIQLFIGRMLTGIAMGMCAASVGIYLAEISITSWKTVITVTPNIALTTGILIVYLLGFVLQNNWRLIAAFFIILSILFLLCNIFFIPESPEWLLLKGRKEDAKIALLCIRGLHQETTEFQEEFTKMINYIESKNKFEISQNYRIDFSSTKKTGQRFFTWNVWSILKRIWRTILLPEVWKPFVILNLYLLFQKLCGLYVIIFYTVDLITRINITIDPFLITVIVGIIQLVGIVITACCSKRIGRRTISIVSGVGISISLGVLAVYLQFFENIGITTIPIVCILFYVSLQLLLLYCIVVQSYVIHEDGFTSTELKTESEVSKETTTSANTGIIDQNSNESFQSDQVEEFVFPLGPKAHPIGHIRISSNDFEWKEWLLKLPIEWEKPKQDSLKKITPDNNDSSKETSDKTLSDKAESPLHPKDDGPIEEVASTMFPEIENPGTKRNHTESHFVLYLFGRPVITYHVESNEQGRTSRKKHFYVPLTPSQYVISIVDYGYKWIKILMRLLMN
ncbi:TRET1 protein, partial [Acromyrmex heyeri]